METDLGLVVDSLPGLIWIGLASGAVEYLNRPWCEYTGLRAEEGYGDGWQRVVHPHDLPIVTERWRHMLITGEPAEIEARLRRADGEYRWFLLSSNPVRNAGGRIVKWCGVSTDIEQQKRSEETLRARDMNLRLMVDSIPGPVAVMTPDGKREHANAQLLDFFGKSLEELNDWEADQVVHPDEIPHVIQVWNEAMATGCTYELECRYLRWDGLYRWCHTRGFPFLDSEGRIVRWFVLLTDIDDRRRAEDALRASEENLRLIVDSIPGLVFTNTPDGEVESVNRQLLEYFGVTLDEVKRWATTGLIHPDDAQGVIEAWNRSVASGQPHNHENRLRRADGAYRWFQVHSIPRRDAEGTIVRWYALLTDIDDRKRAEMLLAGERHLLEMVAGGHPLIETLDELCRLVESTDDACRCSVLLIDAAGTRLEQGVSPGMPPSFLNGIIGQPIAAAASPSAMACLRGERVIAADVVSETRWASGWCPLALAHGVRACWATPFSSSAGHVLGAFTIYYPQPKTPTASQQSLIERFTHIARIAVERAQSSAALMRSEARKAAILDSALDCIITIDHEGRIVEFNPAAERTFGYRRDEVIGRPMADVIVPAALREQYGHGFLHNLATANPEILGRRVERMARRADGSEFPIEVAITRIASNGPPMFTGFSRDITAAKQAIEERNWAQTRLAGEKQLLEMIASGRPLRDVLDALCNFVEQATSDCLCAVHLIDWSGSVFHDGAAPSLGPGYFEALNGIPVRRELGPCADAAVTKCQVIGEDLRTEPRWKGTPFETLALQLGLQSVWSTPIYSLGGAVLGTFAMYQREPASPSPRQRELIAQVTHIASIAIERTQAGSALERSRALLAEGERLSLTGTFWWRVTTDEITWSEQVYRIFEFDRDTAVTLERIGTRLHPEDVQEFQGVIERARTDPSDFEYELRLQMPGGSVKHLRVVAHSTRDHDGRPEYIGAVQDVTERRFSEEALGKVRSELAHVARVSSLGTLAASIAHEVNQPLSGIITNASTCLRMLDSDLPNVEGARETARRTIRDAHRASEVVTRLRALFSKKGSTIEPVDLNEATREVIALSRSELQRKRVVLLPELADDLPLVKGDRVQLQQVILNLLLNASDAMSDVDDRPRQAVITTELADDGVRFTVSDTGQGLAPQAADKVFEPFYTTKDEGMGIGLAVSRSIIESHRGRIWAAPNDGPGATFAFSLPRSSNGEFALRDH